MNKLTNQQIEQVNQKLIDYGFTFIDVRIEVLDHILCLIEEKGNILFIEAVDLVFEEQKEYLKKIKNATLAKILSQRSLFRDFIMNPIFWCIWLLSFIVLLLANFMTKEFSISNLIIIPFQLIAIPFIFYLIYFFISKRKSTDTFANFFTVSYLLYGYILGVNYFKESQTLVLACFVSFGISVSLMLYYLPIIYKIKNDRKFKNLLNQ